jgi:hypothetical protein
MAHGVSRSRGSRPHQAQRVAGRQRRRVLTYAQDVRVAFADGKATQATVTDATRWAANMDRLTGRA